MAKPVIYGKRILDAVSATTAQVSPETVVGQLDKLTYQCKFSQPATGTFVVEAKSQNDRDSGAWYALDFGSGGTSITAETDVIFNLSELPFSHLRISWGGDAGNAGTLTITIAAKAVGA